MNNPQQTIINFRSANTYTMSTLRTTRILLPLLMLSLPVAAQKKQFTIMEATTGMATTLAPKGLRQASWEPGTVKLYHAIKDGSYEGWVYEGINSGKRDTLFDLKGLNRDVYGKDKLKAMPTFQWLSEGVVYFTDGNEIKLGTKTADGFKWTNWVTLPDNAENVKVDKSRNIAYTIDNNLWLVTKDKKTIQLTNDANKDIINGGSTVHRNEFGIEEGIFFSPEGNYVAYYRMDQTMVADYPIINWLADPATVKNIKYPMAGDTSHQVTLNVYNLTTGKTTTLKTEGEKDHYLTSITWNPNEKYMYVGVLNRGQDHMWMNEYDIQSGNRTKTLFEETDKEYVEPQSPLSFLPGSDDRFIYWSQRDGYMHLYLYNTNGKLVRQLTKGKWIVNEIVGFNKDENQVLITASKESPLEKHGYAVNWNNGNITKLTRSAGTHTVTPNESGKMILDVYTSSSVPKRTQVRSTNGNMEKIILDAPNTLADYERPQIKSVELKADDGTPLYGKMILPTSFNENRKYPVVVYLYNGPHVQLIKNGFPASGNLWYEYMAQRGYIVFTMDGRGSANRGAAFEQAIHRNLGTKEMSDQLKGVEYLKSLPYVDSK
ncbi:MAG: prolyl tripeptidyl peptidase, partial [Flavipsychrobacter sp.]|nr:prolyl tripeptidyl peptidase [Flavipsychrobacter sp.]